MKIKRVFIAALSVLSGLFSSPVSIFGQQPTLPKDKQHGAILHAFCCWKSLGKGNGIIIINR